MLDKLKNDGRRLVTIIDPHLKVDEKYFLYKIANQKDLLCKTNKGLVYQDLCWPGKSSWLDYFNPEVTQLLTDVYSGSYHEGDPDFIWNDSWVHIWNDMNEPAVFNKVDKTFPKSNIHHGDVEHREVHSLYGHKNAKATYQALT
jgi:mannosyl-oligosaccharide alpha-1,3-glucosidase